MDIETTDEEPVVINDDYDKTQPIIMNPNVSMWFAIYSGTIFQDRPTYGFLEQVVELDLYSVLEVVQPKNGE
ncbi:uncharacterized protein PHALS_11787 [Plasmopara halstedii]|uniref:Uncharacterized protein n=1 Tax=Plasmopara halstedii TaxID=4781 RepID=A0A0P1AKA8_PLAHL|nr:uncharacterized protein PHALS_11787 [Plasmopara halstedii]CEG41440.1 hypothetical protein PHALS_11787 [Plasmopara halstedii]|eukprot:XP_024577809.1 hypothetical protein PHALS_11787 [Plasmopara halstedii]